MLQMGLQPEAEKVECLLHSLLRSCIAHVAQNKRKLSDDVLQVCYGNV